MRVSKRLRPCARFSRYWDLVANSGHFTHWTQLLLDCPSPFARFFAFSAWLYDRTGHRTHGISRGDLTAALREYLIGVATVEPMAVDAASKEDQRPRRKDLPKRQAQHVGSGALLGLQRTSCRAKENPT